MDNKATTIINNVSRIRRHMGDQPVTLSRADWEHLVKHKQIKKTDDGHMLANLYRVKRA